MAGSGVVCLLAPVTFEYYRAFNYPEGKFQENQNLYDMIHGAVTQALRQGERAWLGFFLKSDRFYPPERFQRENLFKYQQMTGQDHLRSLAFNTSDNQYRDMFDFLVQQRYHYFRELGAYHHKINTLQPVSEKVPKDPLQPYDELLQQLFPGYCFSDRNEEIPSNLFVEIPRLVLRGERSLLHSIFLPSAPSSELSNSD
jgi:hypothetical protein